MISYTHTTAAIAALLLSLPSRATSACLNDQDYKYNDGGRLRPCSNIRLNETRRQTLCLLSEVREACPQTCGICCDDDPDFSFPLKSVDTSQDCAWITKNSSKTDVRRENYCKMSDRVGDTSIRNMCPLACDICQELIAVTPTAAPVSVTGSPTVSPAPSSSPTRPPSPMPSPFPTLRPTASPSISPSDLPSVSPSDAPTGVPSVSPSDVPTVSPSSSPSGKPSASPSATPTVKPSASPSAAPVVPTASPTGAPTASPVTNSPTVTPACMDDATFSFPLVNFPDISQDCAWITKNESKEAARKKKYCAMGEIKYAGCPVTCDGCTSCEDVEGYTFSLTFVPGTTQNCAWISTRNVDKRRGMYCGTEVGMNCPASCGFCG